MDDTIGELLETQEHFSPAKAAAVRDCLLAAGKYGLAGLPLAYKVKFGWCMLHYKMTFADGVALYGKYVGNWGGEATRWRFDAVQDGNVVRSVTLCPSAKLHLEVKASRTTLREQDTYDMAAVRVRILDENGTPAPYAQFPVQFAVEGNAALVGPQTAVAEGGMTGTYLRTVGTAGESVLTVSAPQTQPVVLRFTIERRMLYGTDPETENRVRHWCRGQGYGIRPVGFLCHVLLSGCAGAFGKLCGAGAHGSPVL